MADNVIKKVIDMRKGKTAILPSIVTNPELTGEEESLKSVEINGTKYTIGGGDGQLKLVATGTYGGDEYDHYYELDNPLNDNKNYLILLIGDQTTSSTCIYKNGAFVTSLISAYDIVFELHTFYLTYDEETFGRPAFELFDREREPVTQEYNDYTIKVYEIPLTFNEEPKPSNKMKLVASGKLLFDSENVAYSTTLPLNIVNEDKLYLLTLNWDETYYTKAIIKPNFDEVINIITEDEETSLGYVYIMEIDEWRLGLGSTNSLTWATDVSFNLYELPYEFEI